jgi:hypothetical protein
MTAARELVIADEPGAWERLGFAPDADGTLALGELTVRLAGHAAGSGLVALRVEGLRAERPDGLPVVAAAAGAPRAAVAQQPNGATAIDHAVVFTDDRDRTAAALAAAGGDVRRRGGPPDLPAPMAFVRFGALIVEVAQAGGPARFWGLTIVVPDLDALAGPLVGSARPAVQPGRRIATVKREAGLALALALITPR